MYAISIPTKSLTLNYWKYAGTHENQWGAIYFKYALIAGYDEV